MSKLTDPRMLYRHPGPHAIHGGSFDYVIVSEADVSATLADGWHLSTTDALAAAQKPAEPAVDEVSPPTVEELRAKAAELGIAVDGRWSMKRLQSEIEAKL